jgi:hypothetical protein
LAGTGFLDLALFTAIGWTPAAAVPLISFTDNSGSDSGLGFLSDTDVNWAVSWTQSVASADVTVRALIDSNVGTSLANWWITDQIGPGTLDPNNVVYAGTYTALDIPFSFDFNGLPRTTLATGLSFAAGTYYLVLDGPPGIFRNNAEWIGDIISPAVTLAPGFTLGTYAAAVNPQPFGPASTFAPETNYSFVFELESVAVPEPSTWLLLASGLLGLVWRMRSGATA